MQINQQLFTFNQVLTEEINKKYLKNYSLVSANRSLASLDRVLTKKNHTEINQEIIRVESS